MISKPASIFSVIVFMLLAGCQRNEYTLNNKTDDFFHLKHKGALMPVWVQGNTASKIFLIHIHGGPGGESLGSFNVLARDFSNPLEEKYANVYYDQRASGSSQGTFDKDLFTEEQYAEDLYKLTILLKHHYAEDIIIYLLGSSWGGRLGTRFLLNPEYQKEVHGWISIAGAQDLITVANSGRHMLEKYARIYIDEGRNKKEWQDILNWSLKYDTIVNTKQWLEQNEKAYEAIELIDDSLHHELEVSTASALKWIFISPSNILSVLMQSWTFSDNLVQFTDFNDSLQVIQVPSLIISAKFDFVVPPEVGYKAFHNIGAEQKRLVVLEHSAHNIILYETSRCVDEIIDFIEEFN